MLLSIHLFLALIKSKGLQYFNNNKNIKPDMQTWTLVIVLFDLLFFRDKYSFQPGECVVSLNVLDLRYFWLYDCFLDKDSFSF
jgi:hypothetical protein